MLRPLGERHAERAHRPAARGGQLAEEDVAQVGIEQFLQAPLGCPAQRLIPSIEALSSVGSPWATSQRPIDW